MEKGVEDHILVVRETFKRCGPQIKEFIELTLATLKRGGKIAFIGNGGSAADSQHLAAEFVGRFSKDRDPLPAIALTTDTSILTALGNDYGFEEIFSRQVDALLKEGDMLVAISTSGESRNIVKAVLRAKKKRVKVVGLLGKGGGRLKELCDIPIVVPSDSTPRIQEVHILIGHLVCEEVEKALYG